MRRYLRSAPYSDKMLGEMLTNPRRSFNRTRPRPSWPHLLFHCPISKTRNFTFPSLEILKSLVLQMHIRNVLSQHLTAMLGSRKNSKIVHYGRSLLVRQKSSHHQQEWAEKWASQMDRANKQVSNHFLCSTSLSNQIWLSIWEKGRRSCVLWVITL